MNYITIVLECESEQLKKIGKSLFEETSWGTVIEIGGAECADKPPTSGTSDSKEEINSEYWFTIKPLVWEEGHETPKRKGLSFKASTETASNKYYLVSEHNGQWLTAGCASYAAFDTKSEAMVDCWNKHLDRIGACRRAV